MISWIRCCSPNLVFITVLVLSACSTEPVPSESPYDRLCAIYEQELSGHENPGPAKFQMLSNRLDRELPELEDHLHHLAALPREDFYPTLKALAESEQGKPWECEFLKRRYR